MAHALRLTTLLRVGVTVIVGTGVLVLVGVVVGKSVGVTVGSVVGVIVDVDVGVTVGRAVGLDVLAITVGVTVDSSGETDCEAEQADSRNAIPSAVESTIVL